MSTTPHTPGIPVMLVAGGTGSIGRVIAAQALAAGWRVVVHGRSLESAQTCVEQMCIEQRDVEGRRALLLPLGADIKESDADEKLVQQAAAWGDRLDAVVDCVSTGPSDARLSGPFAATEPHGYAGFLDLSVAHLQRLTHAALPRLKQRGGTLIAFASDAGRFAAPAQSVVGASRAAIIGFVRNLAVEVARDAVRVHCISPSFVADSNSARRLGADGHQRMQRATTRAGLGLPTAEDIAPLVLFLCGPGARRLTGQIISVNGGMHA